MTKNCLTILRSTEWSTFRWLIGIPWRKISQELGAEIMMILGTLADMEVIIQGKHGELFALRDAV